MLEADSNGSGFCCSLLSSVGFSASAPEPAHQIYTRASDSHSRFFFAPLRLLSFPLRTGRRRLRPSSSSLAWHRAQGWPLPGHGGCDWPPPPLPLASRRALTTPGACGARRRPQAAAWHRPSSALPPLFPPSAPRLLMCYNKP